MNSSAPPAFAKSVTIARIKTQHSPLNNDEQHLRQHFATTQHLSVGQVFSLFISDPPTGIAPDLWLEYCQETGLEVKTRLVRFKVLKAIGFDNKSMEQGFDMNSEETTLYQIADVGSYVPSSCQFPELWGFYESESEFVKGVLKGDEGKRGIYKNTRGFPILVTGGVGSRKADFVTNIASTLGLNLFTIRAVSYCGETAGALETKFISLSEQIKSCSPCLVYMDHIELLGRTRDGLSSEPRVLLAIHSLLASLECKVVGSCSDTDEVLDEIKAMFCTQVSLSKRTLPQLTSYLASLITLSPDVQTAVCAQLVRYSVRTVDKVVERLKGLEDELEWKGVLEELEGTEKQSMIPDTAWEDIGGVDHVRREIHDTIEMPLLYPKLFKGSIKRSGLLLYGKPGCGKTMVARAIASQCQLHFISIQGPELLNSFVGQSEKNVRDIFEEARAMAPTVLFFDEIDAIAPTRSGGVIDRVLSQLLSEMDGIVESENVFVIGATNRPELLDPGLTRPGRLDRRVEVAVGEDEASRLQVFTALSRKLTLSPSVCLTTLASSTGPLSGAECYAVILNACYNAVERCVEEGREELVVQQTDLMKAV